jgi:methionyl-tRNA formyltransferase
MRVAILAHSFSDALRIFKEVDCISGNEIFIVLSPSPHRSPWSGHLANLARIARASLKSFKPIQLLTTARVVLLFRPLDHEHSVARLKKLNLDVGLHKTGVVYRESTIGAFRLGILNPHIGILPAYRGRCVMEWSVLQGDPAGVTVFFIDSGIDTGSRILLAGEVDISRYHSIAAAKEYLFSLDAEYFRKALTLLQNAANDSPAFRLNDGSGRRYYVMSKLFADVVQQLLQEKT